MTLQVCYPLGQLCFGKAESFVKTGCPNTAQPAVTSQGTSRYSFVPADGTFYGLAEQPCRQMNVICANCQRFKFLADSLGLLRNCLAHDFFLLLIQLDSWSLLKFFTPLKYCFIAMEYLSILYVTASVTLKPASVSRPRYHISH